jgi:hypothetical protein
MRVFCWTQNSRVGTFENATTKEWMIRSNFDVIIAAKEERDEGMKQFLEGEAAGVGRGKEEREKLTIFSVCQKIMSLRMPGLFQ